VRKTDMRRYLAFVLGAVLAASTFSLAQDPGSTGVAIVTYQNDTHRTGRNVNEATLVSPLTGFGQLCNVPLDGQVYAQPLIETSVTINGTHYTGGVAYVVTQNDTLYAINGTPASGNNACSVLASLPLLPILTTKTGQTNTAVDCTTIGSGGCPVDPVVGILGTPVINVSNHTGTIYLVTFSQDAAGNYYHYLHAIDIQRFQEQGGGPFLIGPPGQNASNFSLGHIQRPGLLLANGYVYVAFSMIDGYPPPFPNGAVFGYDTSDLGAQPLYFQTSLGLQIPSNGGGIWQGGAAPAYGKDSTGTNYIYLKTANGTYDGTSNWGDSFLKLTATSTSLSVPSGGYFTPADQYYRSNGLCTTGYQGSSPAPGDLDFGSGGVMLIPDLDLATWPYLAVSGDKEGGIWFNDRTAPATPPHVTSCDPSNCLCSAADGVVQAFWTTTPNFGQAIHNNPAYWKGGGTSYMYMSTTTWYSQNLKGTLVRYPLCSTANSQYPIDTTCGAAEEAVDPTPTSVSFPYGVTPAVSAANSTATDAIVWAIWGDGSRLGSSKAAVLYAFDGADTTGTGKLQQLYASSGNGSTCAADAMSYAATKFSVPTVANGFVYVGTQGSATVNNGNSGMFYIFGSNRTCP
jgi:hypothetical protein